MDFIVENYIWFLVGGGLIFMALIGFVAEKTNFGRGNSKKKEKKQTVKEEKVETNEVPNPVVEEQPILENDQFNVIPDLNTEAEKEEVKLTDPLLTPDINNQDLYAGLDQFTVEKPEDNASNEDLNAPLDTNIMNQENTLKQPLDLNQPLENAVNETIESPVDIPEVTEDVPEVPEQTVSEVSEIPEVKGTEVVDLENEELKEQNVQSLSELEENAEAPKDSSEEIWKF